MLLAIDVGNTHTVIGLYQQKDLVEHWRIETAKERTADELGVVIRELFRATERDPAIAGIIISNVVPELQHALERMSSRYFKTEAVFVSTKLRTGIQVAIDQPEELGADRLVNAVAAHRYIKGKNIIVVDLGTATTFDCITSDGIYIGGAIAPGMLSSHEALAKKASRLPRTDIRKPAYVIGKNTRDSLQSGLYFGYAGLIDGVVTRLKAELKSPTRVIATGGLAGLIAQATTSIEEVLPNLTLDGLRLIWERMQNKSLS